MKIECGTSEHWARRSFLKAAGASSIGWLTTMAESLARQGERSSGPAKSIIVLWLAGGPSQLDTFDPHPEGRIGGGVRSIKTSAKGVKLASGFERLAGMMDDVALVRSMVSDEGDHARAMYQIMTGHRIVPGLAHPSLGSVICHELPESSLDIPSHVSILPGQQRAMGGYLGAGFDAFNIGDPVKPIPDVRERVSHERAEKRLSDLAVVEGPLSRKFRSDEVLRRARRMMGSEQLKAFEVNDVPVSMREVFGDHSFGRGCLAAVQLIEAGVRCVEVTLKGFDTHINNAELQAEKVAELDPAFSELIRQLKERGLFDSTVVVCGGEFGRTPVVNAAEGRDHWPTGFSIALAGGGIVGGRVIGETDPAGEKRMPSNPVTVSDLHATIQTALGIDPEFEVMAGNRPIPLSEGRVIKELLNV